MSNGQHAPPPRGKVAMAGAGVGVLVLTAGLPQGPPWGCLGESRRGGWRSQWPWLHGRRDLCRLGFFLPGVPAFTHVLFVYGKDC